MFVEQSRYQVPGTGSLTAPAYGDRSLMTILFFGPDWCELGSSGQVRGRLNPLSPAGVYPGVAASQGL